MTKEMSDSTPKAMQIPFRKLPGLSNISSEACEKLQNESSLLRFRIGQPLADHKTMPATAYWVIEGNAVCST